MKSQLMLETWSLHFDGKKIGKKEYQAIVLKNSEREIKLAALELEDGKAETIANGISDVIEDFNLWHSIQMIVADTTSVNTGKKNGVVVRIQQKFTDKGFEAPQFVSCQHHVLDRILRLVMDDELGSNTKSPEIEYFFVSDVSKNYDQLRSTFRNGTEKIVDRGGWRDDMKFLYHLTKVLRFYHEHGRFPLVEFKALPNISNARWNSRAILAILAYILMPSARSRLRDVCLFISNAWADLWFSDQMYCEADFLKLAEALMPYKSALACLESHWKREPSVINIPRTNQCCERAVKVMQEVQSICKDKTNVSLRFLLTNNVCIEHS